MITAGCDVGSLTAKAVILADNRVLAARIAKVKSRPEASAREIMESALEEAGLRQDQIECCIGTGYGREQIPFVAGTMSEVACHARGAKWLLPSIRTVIDIGGQDCKVMRVDDRGKLVKFATNDKCAAGTGRFLDVMARMLHVEIGELGGLALKAVKPLNLSSTCTVWAQAEVVKKVNEGETIEDIAGAISHAMANRVMILVNSVGPENDICITGGVSKNAGVVASLERLMGVRVKRLRTDPQAVGALGAAIFAQEQLKRRSS
jgi:predicted CoA-substrate-specific enzyme activase